jgi:phage terminase large subunit-like protein
VLGSVEPTTVTPPLRDDLWTNPESSWGYHFSDFCTLIGWPLREWQHRLAIRLGELFPDGSPRYRKAIILIARQNGKTLFTRLLILYWMFVERVTEIVATSTDRAAAKRSWKKVVEMAERTEVLAAALPSRHTALQIGEEDFWNDYGSHYRFSAPTRRAGRGDTVDRALLDELREHRNRDTWDAIVPAQNAVPDGLLVCISNEGDAESVVLHEEYDAAHATILTGEGDQRVFLAAWSAPTGTDPDDVDALAQANPSLGDGIELDALLGQARVAIAAGGETLARFKIEIMCQRVDLLKAAIRLEDWNACGVQRADFIDLANHRREVALTFEVAQDYSHASLLAAVKVGDLVWGEVVAAWNGYECRKELRRDLPGWVERIKPRKVGWIAGGPAQSVADEFATKRIRNVLLEPIRAEDVVRACMGLEEQVAAGQFRHAHDPLMNEQVKQAQQLPQGDGWRFARRGKAPIDTVYGMAAAVHLARGIKKLGPAA